MALFLRRLLREDRPVARPQPANLPARGELVQSPFSPLAIDLIRLLGTLLVAIALFGQASTAHASAALFTTHCAGCHPGGPISPNFNAAGNVAVITQANTNGMGAGGTLADHTSIATYIASVKPSITNAPVPHNTATVIAIPDLAVSFYAVITAASTVPGFAPTKGTVSYNFVAGTPTLTYTPNPGQSGTDTWRYRGTGSQTTSDRIASVIIAAPPPPVITSANSSSGTGGQAFNFNVTATNSPTSFSALGLPTGLSINAAGLISGTPTQSGVFNVTLGATNAGGTGNQAFTLTINLVTPVITSLNTASGNGGQAFNYTITASNLPASFGATGLPAGLSVAAGTGVISGTPTVTGVFNVTISATNTAGTGNQALTLTINLVTPAITSSLTSNATSGSPYTYTITANNLPASFNATGLPTGLTVDTVTGIISGTPVVAMGGPVNVMISATNATGTDTQTLVLTVSLNAPTITSAATASGTSGTPFSYQITATDFPSSFGATGLPAGLTVNAAGLISGTVVVGTTTLFNVMVSATNGSGTTSQAVAITITLPPPAITSAASVSGTVTISFSYQITASNGPTSFGASGLPTGLSVNTTTGVISGVPTVLGTTNATISATNSSGTAMQALVITIANQPPPNATPVGIAVPFNTPTSYDLTASVTGNYTGVTITSQVSHGTLVVSGMIVTYTPFTGYFGTDSFAYTATGPGGTSPPATATLTVAPPGAPTVSAKSVTVVAVAATAIDLTSSISGVATSVTVSTAPANGTTTVSGKVVTYTPNANFVGEDVFSFTATGPGGTSMPADVTVKVTPLAPTAETVTFILPLNTPTTLDLAPFIKGTAITGVAMVGAPKFGTVTVNGTKVTYTPNTDYFGADAFTYSAYGIAGSSPAATVRVTVVGRPDPTKDTNVTGLLAAQVDSAQRFSRAQITNFQGRMESLHRSGASGVAPPPGSATTPAASPTPAPAPATKTTAQSGNSADGRNIDGAGRNSAFLQTSVAGPVPAGTAFPFANELSSILTTRSLNVATLVAASSGAADASSSGSGSAGTAAGMGPLNFWISGVANFGRRVATNERNQLDFTTDGVSIGVDRRFSDKLAAGIGVGFARDHTDIGTDGSKSRGQGASIAAYASYHPSQNTFIDGLLGAGSLDFKTDRYVKPIEAYASADRSGRQLFASLATGYEYRDKGYLLSPYARLDYSSDRFNQVTETGAGQYSLTYFSQTTPSLQGVLGLRAEALNPTNYGWATPRARLEYRREFQGDRDATLAYADTAGGTRYIVNSSALSRNTLLLGLGADFIRRGGLTIGLDYQLQHNFNKDSAQGLRLNFMQDLDALGSPSALRGFFTIPKKPEKIQVDAGFMYDTNVTRANTEQDKRSDRAYSANVGKGFRFDFEDADQENLRATVNLTLGGEKFQRYDGLSRVMAGIEAELQYRTSAEYDAVTFAAFARSNVERYRSELRNGYRYTAGISARQSVTDRIDIFAALAHNGRISDSSVFTNRDNSFRLNLDYLLSDREVLYVTGEYRRGNTFSTGSASLGNLDIADVFAADDAFPGEGLFVYRFDASGIISTLGYNLGFGPRHSLDISWRRATVTPRQKSSFSSGSSNYVTDQYSLIYLVRF